jgi:hypothetical protein
VFVRTLRVEYVGKSGAPQPCPLAWIDNFAMRNFTNSAVFDDTLPVADGQVEVGLRVPIDALTLAMDEWFRKKGYLREGDRLLVREMASGP